MLGPIGQTKQAITQSNAGPVSGKTDAGLSYVSQL